MSQRYDDGYQSYQDQLPTYTMAAADPMSGELREPHEAAHSTSTTRWARAPSSARPHLDKTIAIPSTAARRDAPFIRAYPPALASFSISSATFLSFLDTLNRVAAKAPPLQVLSLAGDVVGFVPLATAQIVGGAVSVAAGLTQAALNYGQTESELKRANKELFGPNGLRVEIAKLDAVARLTGMPILDNDGRVKKKVAILDPMDDMDSSTTSHHRILSALQSWIAPLELRELSTQEMPQNQYSRFQTKIIERQRVRGEKKTLEKRAKVTADFEEDSTKTNRKFEKNLAELDKDLAKEMNKIEEDRDKAQRKEKPEKLAREFAKLDRKAAKALEEYEREKDKLVQRYEEDAREIEQDKAKDDKEEKGARKRLWLVIREIDPSNLSAS